MPGGGGESIERVRLDSLTSLRFVAAMLVLLFHSSGLFLRGLWITKVFDQGFVGVSFFFVLSGFVLTWSRSTPTRPRRFYAHRFARVWPLHALAWLVVLIVVAAQGEAPGAGPTVANLFLVHDWIPLGRYYYSVNQPSWTLSCEVFFYLLFPFTVSVLGSWSTAQLRRRGIGIAGVLTLGTLLIYAVGSATSHAILAQYLVYNFPVVRFAEFVLGIVLALLIERGWRSPVGIGLSFAVALLPCVVIANINGLGSFEIPLELLVTLPGFMLLIAAAASSDLRGRSQLLVRSWPVRLGKWSFASYLIQGPVFAVLEWAGVKAGTNVVDELLLVAGVVLLSGVVFETFERPVERYLRATLAPTSPPSVTSDVGNGT